jgi:hypothetical protein
LALAPRHRSPTLLQVNPIHATPIWLGLNQLRRQLLASQNSAEISTVAQEMGIDSGRCSV